MNNEQAWDTTNLENSQQPNAPTAEIKTSGDATQQFIAPGMSEVDKRHEQSLNDLLSQIQREIDTRQASQEAAAKQDKPEEGQAPVGVQSELIDQLNNDVAKAFADEANKGTGSAPVNNEPQEESDAVEESDAQEESDAAPQPTCEIKKTIPNAEEMAKMLDKANSSKPADLTNSESVCSMRSSSTSSDGYTCQMGDCMTSATSASVVDKESGDVYDNIDDAKHISEERDEAEFTGTINLLEWKDFIHFYTLLANDIPARYEADMKRSLNYGLILNFGEYIPTHPVLSNVESNKLLTALAGFADFMETFSKGHCSEVLSMIATNASKIHKEMLGMMTQTQEPKQHVFTENPITPVEREAYSKLSNNVEAVMTRLKELQKCVNGKHPIPDYLVNELAIASASVHSMDNIVKFAKEYNEENPPTDNERGAYDVQASSATAPTLLFNNTPIPIEVEENGKTRTLTSDEMEQLTKSLQKDANAKSHPLPPPTMRPAPSSAQSIPVHIGNADEDEQPHYVNRKQVKKPADQSRIHTLKPETNFNDLPTYVYDIMVNTSHSDFSMRVGNSFSFTNVNSARTINCTAVININTSCNAPVLTVNYQRTVDQKCPMSINVCGCFTTEELNSCVNARKLYNMLIDELNQC